MCTSDYYSIEYDQLFSVIYIICVVVCIGNNCLSSCNKNGFTYFIIMQYIIAC